MKSKEIITTVNSERLNALALQALGPTYKPRTKHLLPSGKPKYTNHLIRETSPYLLQHAHNPVNWYAWGADAFEKAKKENKPILLSIGYSTCHWCHVMEEESFENEEIANYLNEHYVAIKVDREERPDIDSTYMAALHAMGISGGWPLNVWLSQDKKPFYGGTYFPPKDGFRGRRQGFLSVLTSLKDAFVNKGELIEQSSAEIVRVISAQSESTPNSETIDTVNVLDRAVEQTKARFDDVWGGVKAGNRRTKFPSSLPLRFLLRRATGKEKDGLYGMIQLTLQKMFQGGMYDQIGGGFHRYSTDEKWQIPHFEKMLYDNALLAVAYTEAYQAIGSKEFRHIATDTLDYVARDMRHEHGGFFSATDADSLGPSGHREEGYYFSWTPEELKDSLSDLDERTFAAEFFDINGKGNFEGRSVPTQKEMLLDFAKKNKLEESSVQTLYDSVRTGLRAIRSKRDAPGLDDKVLTAWNGLMISAFSRASLVFAEKQIEYKKTALAAGDFVFGHLYKNDTLFRTFRQSEAKIPGFLQDYAFMIAACMDLFEMSQDAKWLRRAIVLDQRVSDEFEDPKGGYYLTSQHSEKVLIRQKSSTDGAIPSGASVQLMNLYRLYQFTVDPAYLLRAERAVKSLSKTLIQAPTALGEMLIALDFEVSMPLQIVLVEPTVEEQKTKESLEMFLSVVNQEFLPSKVVIALRGKASDDQLSLMPWLKEKRALGGRVTAYICQDTRCQLPAKSLDEFKNQLTTFVP